MMEKINPHEVADLIVKMLKPREGEVLTDDLIHERANNIACALVDTQITWEGNNETDRCRTGGDGGS